MLLGTTVEPPVFLWHTSLLCFASVGDEHIPSRKAAFPSRCFDASAYSGKALCKVGFGEINSTTRIRSDSARVTANSVTVMLAEKEGAAAARIELEEHRIYRLTLFLFILKAVTVIVSLKDSSMLIAYNFDSRPPIFIKTMNESFVLTPKAFKTVLKHWEVEKLSQDLLIYFSTTLRFDICMISNKITSLPADNGRTNTNRTFSQLIIIAN